MERRKELEDRLRRLQGLFTRFYSKVLTERRLTIPQFSLLIIVADEGPLKMQQIAAKLHLASSSITNLVDRLEVQKMLQRRQDPGDRGRYRGQ